MTSSPHGPYVRGYTRATMVGTERREPARGSQSAKADLSTDCSLQLDCMKLESLVIPDQHAGASLFGSIECVCVARWRDYEMHSLARGGAGYSRSVKEVIQPQVPLRLPCYDFTPVTSHTIGG